MKIGQNLPTIERLITQERIDKYADASGDFNPIHIDRKIGEASQFGSNVAHGMMVAATISEMMTQAFGRWWTEGGRLKIRFKAPVRPGDTVTAFGEVTGISERDDSRQTECSVGVRKQTGEDAITGDAVVVIPRCA